VAKLLGDIAEPAALVADEEERNDLEDPFALPVEPVADVAELPQRPSVRARLLGDLAQRRLLTRLAAVDSALRQGPEPFGAPGRTDRGDDPAAVRRRTDAAENSRRTAERSSRGTEISPSLRVWHLTGGATVRKHVSTWRLQ
jgi:hypothetical protein